MMESLENTEQLIEILEKEIELVDSFTKVENSILDSVIANNWDSLETSINQTKDISLAIESLDKERAACVELLREELGEDRDTHFYHLTVNMESDKKIKINDLYRKLKLSVLNLQNMNWRIDTYVGTVTGIMKQTLKEIYPNRRGSLYSRSGIIKEADNNPMVLNKKL
ncbi:MAG: flagellar export chaperone FlgN [Spirochaetales bacterium]|nr:flagellar export chaperone FlgN [Spirochaetales bacterium]